MYIFRHAQNLKKDARNTSLAIGNFDGVHKGHQHVIGKAVSHAKARNGKSAILTFEPHPRRFFIPDAPSFCLTPYRAKMRMFEALGAHFSFLPAFNQKLAAMPAETFVKNYLVERLDIAHIFVGQGFVFGHQALGNTTLLEKLGKDYGFGVTVVPLKTDQNGDVCSSTAIRKALRVGDIQTANHMLGRRFEIEGRVEQGYKRGRTIGFPTANVPMGEYIHPANGVYAVLAGIDKGKNTIWHKAVANIGKRPTFNLENTLAEVHLLENGSMIYGRHLRIAFESFIRPEFKFENVDALKAQIEKDCLTARKRLNSL